jgi:hypothetical protein
MHKDPFIDPPVKGSISWINIKQISNASNGQLQQKHVREDRLTYSLKNPFSHSMYAAFSHLKRFFIHIAAALYI